MVKADLIHRIEVLYRGTSSQRRGARVCVYGLCMAYTQSISEVTFSSPTEDAEILLKSQQ